MKNGELLYTDKSFVRGAEVFNVLTLITGDRVFAHFSADTPIFVFGSVDERICTMLAVIANFYE